MIYNKYIKIENKQVINDQWDWTVSQQRKSRTHQRLYNSTKPSRRIKSHAPQNRRGRNRPKLIVETWHYSNTQTRWEYSSKENCRPNSLMNRDTKLPSNIPANWIQECISELFTCKHMAKDLRLVHIHKSLTANQHANIRAENTQSSQLICKNPATMFNNALW